ncbi:MAG: hypothetical protein LBO05_09865 [Deltaproteobacteria bacterium]|jgi:hypothetical protein|nr:hypothetical protein [Deltaproteobacteria bacterium]
MSSAKKTDTVNVGEDIDAQCMKCRRVTNHRVVSLLDGVVKRVLCLTCQSQHNYRPPVAAKPAKPASAKAEKTPKEARLPKETKEERVRKEALKAAQDELEQNGKQWRSLREKNKSAPVKYTLDGTYSADQVLAHPRFGTGFVIRLVMPNKIEVQFEDSLRVLVMNIGRPEPPAPPL